MGLFPCTTVWKKPGKRASGPFPTNIGNKKVREKDIWAFSLVFLSIFRPTGPNPWLLLAACEPGGPFPDFALKLRDFDNFKDIFLPLGGSLEVRISILYMRMGLY